MAATAILDFQKFEILTVIPLYGANVRHHAKFQNFIKIGVKVAEIWRFNRFCKMAAVRHLGFVGCVLGPPTMATWWSLSFDKIWLKSIQ